MITVTQLSTGEEFQIDVDCPLMALYIASGGNGLAKYEPGVLCIGDFATFQVPYCSQDRVPRHVRGE